MHLLRRLSARRGRAEGDAAWAISEAEEEARDQAEAAAAYWSRIGADLPMEERRLRGKMFAANAPRRQPC